MKIEASLKDDFKLLHNISIFSSLSFSDVQMPIDLMIVCLLIKVKYLSYFGIPTNSIFPLSSFDEYLLRASFPSKRERSNSSLGN